MKRLRPGNGTLPAPVPLPRCASMPLAARHEQGRVENCKQRMKRASQDVKRLDFHGMLGDVKGLIAFLTHRYGDAVRGWRTAIAPDADRGPGIAPVLRSDFAAAMRKIGYTENVMKTWKSLSGDGKQDSVSIRELDSRLAKGLDTLASQVFELYDGGAQAAWADIVKENAGRFKFDEFEEWISAYDIVLGKSCSPRKLFSALDISNRGSVGYEDFRFIDHWAFHHLQIPLPASLKVDPRDIPPREPWSPPPKKPPKEPGIQAFCRFLESNFGGVGGAARAWRTHLDIKGLGAVSISDFGKGCRAVCWPHDHSKLWNLLVEEGNGLAKLRALDPITSAAIDKFKMRCVEAHGDLQMLWAFLDPAGGGKVHRVDFVPKVSKSLGMTESDVMRIFTTLDTAGTGWMAEAELGFLVTFETNLARCAADKEAAKLARSRNTLFPFANSPHQEAASAPPQSKATLKETIPGGTLGSFQLTWAQSQSPSASEKKITSAASPLGRDLWAPHRSSRSFQFRALHNSHQLKHRWLGDMKVEESLPWNHSEVSPTKRSPSDASSSFVFRATHQFYREGVQKLLGTSGEEEEEEVGEGEA